MKNQHGLDFLTRVSYMAESIWKNRSTTYRGVTRACPCRAQVWFYSEEGHS
ncbi:hypothetical protein F383_06060 [Gossypium arboreum]|uniref:Uncharacterized protein n=1 Tax=Gossypium arboreum TaxID=29729 RepID=A0A0B0P6A2_GOSAR|nr:hypothetical protein F383_06060 [Gossypium arboreum]